MNTAAPEPKANMGRPEPRIDGRLKVTGAARYAADFPVSNSAYAFLVTSPIAKGTIRGFDLGEARAIPGVLDILTYENAGRLNPAEFTGAGGTAATTIQPLASPRVWHDGQIIAMVVADRFEAAREAAYRVKADFDVQKPSATFGSPGTETQLASEVSKRHREDPAVGDIDAGLGEAEVAIDLEYSTPTQHHNAIELFATTCVWEGDQLTIYEPSQFVYGLRKGVAEQLGIDPGSIRVKSPFIGGAFGSKGSVTARTVLVAMAAKRLNRPVKLVATRDQGFTIATYRAETRHRLRLGARRDGKLTALSHEGWEVTSRPDPYLVAGTKTTTRLYASPNVASRVHVVHADRNTPGYMRSPPEVPYVFALETAIDELAVKLGMDPVELRRVNDTMKDPIKGVPYTSRSLMACYDEAAKAFGWSRRNPAPGSTREGDWLIGWGCATATYPSQMTAATARVKLGRSGDVRVQIAAHEIGTGAYTVIGQMAAVRLGVPLANVKVELGDSALPPGPIAGGSCTTASGCSAVLKACDAIRDRLLRAATSAPDSPLAGQSAEVLSFARGHIEGPNGNRESVAKVFERLGIGVIEQYAEWLPHGASPDALSALYDGHAAPVGGPMKDRISYAYGAEFVEVRVHAATREIRVPRIVGAFAAGHIMNPCTARSQYMGAMIWGISSALHEETEIDRLRGRYVNHNLADYLVPVNADVDRVEVILVPEVDTEINPAGVKGIGELANVGTAAAVSNAVYHATGVRIRDLPIRLEKLLIT
jgi:xanthine dehydrogenase YagR molybdenum-binding subunit